MKEYKVFRISREAEDTQEELNILASAGWKLVCSYAYDNEWLIMEREKKQ
jgi:hypothetical protein